MKNTVELKVYVEGPLQEFLIAELGDLDFDVFEQDDGFVRAFIPSPRWDGVKREQIELWLRSHGLAVPVEECVHPPQNWNRRWEETIQPLRVGPFLVKPTWADLPAGHEGAILLEIDPKMSFGTGYHESTRLALQFLPALVRGGERVLDAGTGTGILAIAALKLGAQTAVAFDVDPWAQQNAVENFYLNGVSERATFVAGAIEAVAEDGFDLLLANINRNVLLGVMPHLALKAAPGARIVLAGLLTTDRERMLEAAATHGLAPVREGDEGAWWAVVLAEGAA
ncbi:MAG: 50S ribosomal protein L11 methyltransferase [Rhodothermales bacterium]|nr:50S ribosomal protein L11 methyltransferase [Rhodothermales bacterium]